MAEMASREGAGVGSGMPAGAAGAAVPKTPSGRALIDNLRAAFARSDYATVIDYKHGAPAADAFAGALRQLAVIDRVAREADRPEELRKLVLGALAKVASSRLFTDLYDALRSDPSNENLTLRAVSAAKGTTLLEPGQLGDLTKAVEASRSTRRLEADRTEPSATEGTATGSKGPEDKGPEVGGPGRGGPPRVGEVLGDSPAPEPKPVKRPDGSAVNPYGEQTGRGDEEFLASLERKKRLTLLAVSATGIAAAGVVWGGIKFLTSQVVSSSWAWVPKAGALFGPGVGALIGGKIASRIFGYLEFRVIRNYTDKTEGPLEEALQGVKKPDGFFKNLERSAMFTFNRTGMTHVATRAIELLRMPLRLDAELGVARAVKNAADDVSKAEAMVLYRKTFEELSDKPETRKAEEALFGKKGADGKVERQGSLDRHEANLDFIQLSMGAAIDRNADALGKDKAKELKGAVAQMFTELGKSELAGFTALTPGRTAEWFRLVLGRELRIEDPKPGMNAGALDRLARKDNEALEAAGAPIAFRELALRFEQAIQGIASQTLSSEDKKAFGLEGAGEHSTIKDIWKQILILDENIAADLSRYANGLGLRAAYTAETLLGNEGVIASVIPPFHGGSGALVQIEKPGHKIEATRIKAILHHTEISHPDVPGVQLSSAGNARAWLEFVGRNPDRIFQVPQCDEITGEPIKKDATSYFTVPMKGSQIIELYKLYRDDILTDAGRAAWDYHLDRIDRVYRQFYREQKKVDEILSPLAERVRSGAESPRYGLNVFQRAYDGLYRRISGNSLSITLEPGVGNLEINNLRITLVSYIEAIRKTLRHYDVYNLENELTRETVVANLARETSELLQKMKTRKQEFQGQVIVRPTLAESLYGRYDPLFKLTGEFLKVTFSRQNGALSGWFTSMYITTLGVGVSLAGPLYPATALVVLPTNFVLSYMLPRAKEWFRQRG